MNPLREAAQQALEALEAMNPYPASKEDQRASALAALRAALAQQDEPVEPVAWEASEDGRTIQDNDFTHDVVLRVVGDFENDEQRSRYAQRIVDKLNAASAQQAEPVQEPVGEVLHDWSTEKECIAGTWAHLNDLGKNLPVGTKLYTAQPQRTMVPLTEEEIDALPWNGSPQQFARAVELAHGIKEN